MEDKKYVIELNERQLRLINYALEEYFRIRLNQWLELADDLTKSNIDLSPENPNHERLFEAFITKRDCVRYALEGVGNMIWDNRPTQKTDEQMIAEDMWQVFRHTLWMENHDPENDFRQWCVDAQPPIRLGEEPLPTCRRKQNE